MNVEWIAASGTSNHSKFKTEHSKFRSLHPTHAQRLRLALRIQLRGDGSDDPRFEAEFAENGPDFLNGQRRLIEVQIDDVVVAIDLVTQPGDRLEQTITIKNWTAKPVRLIGGTSDCSCVTTSEMPLTIPSGESLTLTIKLAVPESNAGAFTRIASIWTDCDQQRTIPLRLGCQVE